MNKILFVLTGLLTLPAYALTANTGGTTIGGGVQLGCECPDGTFVAFGATCPNGSTCVSGIDIGDGGDITPTIPCINRCKSTTWTATDNARYETRIYRWCDDETCLSSNQYRCASGYYGNPTSDTDGCDTCRQVISPSPESNPDIETPFAQERCYLPAGPFQDSTGSGELLDNCYYSMWVNIELKK